MRVKWPSKKRLPTGSISITEKQLFSDQQVDTGYMSSAYKIWFNKVPIYVMSEGASG